MGGLAAQLCLDFMLSFKKEFSTLKSQNWDFKIFMFLFYSANMDSAKVPYMTTMMMLVMMMMMMVMVMMMMVMMMTIATMMCVAAVHFRGVVLKLSAHESHIFSWAVMMMMMMTTIVNIKILIILHY